MYLKSLEIAGFKSFAKKAELEFKSPITSIVGPNGSGKSNVAESFRFVLGEQSIKSMRGKKGEDLIFNGSNKVGRMNRAAVKVVFDNSRRIMDLDFDEVVIERAVNRDGTNEYSINGSQVRLKDVHELLAGAHIGATGHHIISQGEADKILTANFRERRAIIEDALGLKVYQYKRAESERKLEKTEENIKQVESLRRELAPHIKFLRKQVERVEKARAMKEDLKALYRDYFRREDAYLKNQRDFLEIEKRAPRAELLRLDAEIVAAKSALSSAKQKDSRGGELIALESHLKGERANRDNLNRDLGRIEGGIAGVERSLKRLELAAAIEENKTVRLHDVHTLRQSVEDFIREGESLSDIGAIKSIFKKIHEALDRFIDQHRNHSTDEDAQKDEFHQELSRLNEEKRSVEQRIKEIREVEARLDAEYLAIKHDIELEKEGSLEAEKAILKIMARQNEINAEFASLKSIEEKLAVETDDFKRELGEAGILAGREAIDYADHANDLAGSQAQETNTDGDIISASESRQVQLDRRRAIEKIKIRLEEFGGGSSDEIMKEFRDSEERDTFLAREIEDLEKSAESLRALIAELKQKLDIEFREGIRKINAQFQDFFALMFGGGTAALQVVKEERRKRKSDLDALGEALSDSSGDIGDIDNSHSFSGEEDFDDRDRENAQNGNGDGGDQEQPEGIDIHVSLPHKKIKGLVMLSGGERALTSIALLFAMSQVNPPPFIILDETDAALDEANSRKYGDMIKNLSRYSQLILITHNRETMSRAGVLYGVTMGGDGISKLLSIEFDEAVKVAK
jgi:chromosome segregation protein